MLDGGHNVVVESNFLVGAHQLRGHQLVGSYSNERTRVVIAGLMTHNSNTLIPDTGKYTNYALNHSHGIHAVDVPG